MKKRKIIVMGIIVLVLCTFLFRNKKNQNGKFEDELIFFKLFYFIQENNTEKQNTRNQEIMNHSKYVFKVDYKNIDFKEIHLADTINKETLVREKIAPRNRRKI